MSPNILQGEMTMVKYITLNLVETSVLLCGNSVSVMMTYWFERVRIGKGRCKWERWVEVGAFDALFGRHKTLRNASVA